MCLLKLADFVSVLVLNKRKNIYDLNSDMIFNHNQILRFLETHEKFVRPHEMLMIFIMARKFRLSLYFLLSTDISFSIDFFTTAIQYNSYDIAFYLLKRYEDVIIPD